MTYYSQLFCAFCDRKGRIVVTEHLVASWGFVVWSGWL